MDDLRSTLDPRVRQQIAIQQALQQLLTAGMEPQPSHAQDVTRLTPAEEAEFAKWAREANVRDIDHPESFYDYRGYWMDVARRGADQRKTYADGPHFPDTYKRRGHPTFSVESKYARQNDPDAGRWDGEVYITPDGRRVNMIDPRESNAYMREWEQRRRGK